MQKMWGMIRTRHKVLIGGALVVSLGLFANSPSWADAVAIMQALTLPLIAVAMAFYVGWKGLVDYPEADAQELFGRAKDGNVAAALALLAKVALFGLCLFAFMTPARAEIPKRAHQYLGDVGSAIDAHWRKIPAREYIPGLIEHESCITLTHSRCWSPTSRLKSQREEGAGLGQVTRAYRKDGSLRFDALAELRDRHPALRELDWSNIYGRPDLQIRAVVLKSRDNYLQIPSVPDAMERLAMADAAYNGGFGGLQAERRACHMHPGCDPARWWGHVEDRCLKSKSPLYGTRSACDINRRHVADVLRHRMPKYEGTV